MTSDKQGTRERANRKGHKGLFKAKDQIPLSDWVKCQASRGGIEAQKNKKMRRDYRLNELTYEYDKVF